ncbi:MAG: iron-sulfur cluster co-chaperone HscB C-terminal domain-containing protein [Chitinophagales bacterium]|nr:hypothetical protein [Chitinophagales bacterium]MDW8394517.1 iron-sulfur cluster co-chaperone HscB C-terminal domain-containing protein [Chitinophagales bacterium]
MADRTDTNFFEWFDLPVSFLLSEADLRERYLERSRLYHPDFFAGRPPQEQQEALQRATLNTRAYETLRDSDRRMRYILEQFGLLKEEDRQQMPSDFLMDMMELNEAVQEAEGAAPEQRQALRDELNRRMQLLAAEVADDLQQFRADDEHTQRLLRIRDYYLKRRYLLRLQQRLDSFEATRQ